MVNPVPRISTVASFANPGTEGEIQGSACQAERAVAASWPVASTATSPIRREPSARLTVTLLQPSLTAMHSPRTIERRCGAPRSAFDERLDQAGDVVAVKAARHETIRIGAERTVIRPHRQPVPEMVGIVGQRAHVGGADVEEMLGIAGMVGEAAADLRSLLDQGDSEIRA